MASDPASFKSLREYSRLAPKRADDLDSIFQELEALQNERIAAIVAGALLESALETAIADILPPLKSQEKDSLFEGRGMFATLSAKIDAAYLFRIIGPETRKDLDCVREIRNALAHSKLHISFAHPEVANVCERMIFPTRFPTYRKEQGAAARYMVTAGVITMALFDLKEYPTHPWLTWLKL